MLARARIGRKGEIAVQCLTECVIRVLPVLAVVVLAVAVLAVAVLAVAVLAVVVLAVVVSAPVALAKYATEQVPVPFATGREA